MGIINKMKKRLVRLAKKSGAGFSLVEMLIVVAIIGILVGALGWGAYGKSLKKSRDGRRKADLEQIRSGLEMYRADQSYYPSSLPSCGGSLTVGSTTYITSIPCDPKGGNYSYSCTSWAGSKCMAYSLAATLEIDTPSPHIVYSP